MSPAHAREALSAEPVTGSTKPHLKLVPTGASAVGERPPAGSLAPAAPDVGVLDGLLEEMAEDRQDGDVEATVILSLERARLRRELRALPARERLTLYLVYGIDCRRQTRKSVAGLLGVNVRTIHRIERHALACLRAQYQWQRPEAA